MQRFVGDAEQPRAERAAVVEFLQLAIGLEHRLLHHVLAVQHRAGHARAIAVQPGPQMRDGLEEGGVARIEQSERVEGWLHVHAR